MVARGLLELGRHDFKAALAWGTRAAKANPDLPDALGVIFDAQVELGASTAIVTAQAMVDCKPTQGQPGGSPTPASCSATPPGRSRPWSRRPPPATRPPTRPMSRR